MAGLRPAMTRQTIILDQTQRRSIGSDLYLFTMFNSALSPRIPRDDARHSWHGNPQKSNKFLK